MKNIKGFTLVELLAVITLIAILSIAGVTAVTSIMNHQKNKVGDIAASSVEDAAISYFANKKIYMPVCSDSSGNYGEYNSSLVSNINNEINDKRTQEYIEKINEDKDSLKTSINSKYFNVKDKNCFNFVTVDELIKSGLLEDSNNACDRNSVVLVYSQGDVENSEGELVAVAEEDVCSN